MTERIFEDKYPDLCGLAYDFSDPPPSHTSDEETAKRIRSDWPNNDRIDIFKRLLSDTDRLLSAMDSDWDLLRIYVNRPFKTADETRNWLLMIKCIWQNELANLEKAQ